MKLRIEQVEEILELRGAFSASRARHEVVERFVRRVGDGSDGSNGLARHRVHAGEDGRLVACLELAPLGEGAWILTDLIVRDGASEEERTGACGLVAEGVAEATDRGAIEILTRPSTDRSFPAYESALRDAGLTDHGLRIEFETRVSDLPGDAGTPLAWSPMEAEGEGTVHRLVGEVSEGDPHWEDDPAEVLGQWLSDPDLRGSRECVHIGRLAGEPVALVIAQAAADGEWARIAYLGVVPTHRGRGIGRWAHRHGFEMMRAQGGAQYVGGTAAANEPMLALFREHGCTERERMTEWVLRPLAPRRRI